MLFCQMCILCPIKVLLPTSHVFNRFMFSICEASSHLQSCLLHILLPESSQENPYHHLIVLSLHPTNLDALSWCSFLDGSSSPWDKGQKGKLIPGRIARLWWRIHLPVHTTSDLGRASSELSRPHPQPAFHLFVITRRHSACQPTPCTAIREEK